MPDPFETLRAPLTPIDPDPAFAAHLRRRLGRALDLPKGATVSDLELEDRPSPVAGGAIVTPYLAVAGAQAAIDWYAGAFGARLRGEPIVMPDGRIGHAELDIGGAMIMLSEESPGIGVTAPTPGQGVPVTIHLAVEDVDVAMERGVAAGAHLERGAADYDYGRNGVIRDPFGHRWLISAKPNGGGLRHGDIGYVSLWVPDVERADRFFSAVLGWRYAPASGHQGRQVEGLGIHHGLWGGVARSTLFCCFAVDDLDAAVLRVRAAGGTAGEPHQEPYGLISECVDDQGVRFAVFQPPGGAAASGHPPGGAAGSDRRPGSGRPPGNGTVEGDLAYVTMEVADSGRARAFYSSVLGWRFESGRIDDGWQVDGVTPMVGLSGGHRVATTVPMYRVDDIATTVRTVRNAGGTATDPEVQTYGVSSICTDDQGTRFYLGQI